MRRLLVKHILTAALAMALLAGLYTFLSTRAGPASAPAAAAAGGPAAAKARGESRVDASPSAATGRRGEPVRAASDKSKSRKASQSLAYAVTRSNPLAMLAPGGPRAPYASRNPNQRLQAFFGSDGLELRSEAAWPQPWSFGLELESWGPRGEAGTSAGAPELSTDGRRMELRRDGMVEWYESKPHALVQGFTLERPPADPPGGIELVLDVSGGLQPTAGSLDGVLRLADGGGQPVLDCRDVTAVDAAGRALPARSEWRGSSLVLSVEAAGAAFPVIVQQQFVLAAVPPADYRQQLVELTNQQRWSWNNGHLPPLKRETTMIDVAIQDHCEDMGITGIFSHDSSIVINPPAGMHFTNGETPEERLSALGYSADASEENLAYGYTTPAATMSAWMGWAPNRTNVLSTDYREFGVGYATGTGSAFDGFGDIYFYTYRYWGQDFGRRDDVYPVVIEREAYSTGTNSVSLYVYGAGWATDMRFSNDDLDWTPWEAYGSSKAWLLSYGDGLKTVYCQLTDGVDVKNATDSIYLSGSVNNAPIVSDSSPASPVTVAVPGPQNFSVVCWDADGDAMTYAWYLDGTVIPGETAATYAFAPIDAAAGLRTLEVRISDGHGHTTVQSWSVTVTTAAGPAILRSPATLSPSCERDHNAAASSFTISNCGTGTPTYTVTVPAGATWLSCSSLAGTLDATADTITVTYSTSSLSSGTYSATISIDVDAPAVSENGTQTVTVNLTVAARPDRGTGRGSGSGTGGGCALAPAGGSAPEAFGWAIPYLLTAGLYAGSRLKRRRRGTAQ